MVDPLPPSKKITKKIYFDRKDLRDFLDSKKIYTYEKSKKIWFAIK